jgi:hypothetical protein
MITKCMADRSKFGKKVKKVKELDFKCKLGNISEMTSANFQSCCKKSAQLISKVALFPTHQTKF